MGYGTLPVEDFGRFLRSMAVKAAVVVVLATAPAWWPVVVRLIAAVESKP